MYRRTTDSFSSDLRSSQFCRTVLLCTQRLNLQRTYMCHPFAPCRCPSPTTVSRIQVQPGQRRGRGARKPVTDRQGHRLVVVVVEKAVRWQQRRQQQQEAFRRRHQEGAGGGGGPAVRGRPVPRDGAVEAGQRFLVVCHAADVPGRRSRRAVRGLGWRRSGPTAAAAAAAMGSSGPCSTDGTNGSVRARSTWGSGVPGAAAAAAATAGEKNGVLRLDSKWSLAVK